MRPPVTAALVLTVTLSAATFNASAYAASVTTTLTGLDLLISLAKARGAPLSASTQAAIRQDPKAFLRSPESLTLQLKLRLDRQLFAALIRNATQLISSDLATRAALETITGRPISNGQIKALLKSNPKFNVTNAASLAGLLNDPGTLTEANAALTAAGTPVTARGGGK